MQRGPTNAPLGGFGAAWRVDCSNSPVFILVFTLSHRRHESLSAFGQNNDNLNFHVSNGAKVDSNNEGVFGLSPPLPACPFL